MQPLRLREGCKRFVNAASSWLWTLQSQRLCLDAQKRTNLLDFGDPSLDPAFSTLLNSLETEAHLHALGRFLMRMHLRELLETRLKLIDSWRGQTESLQAVSIERPIFIVGMPRSGSTFLHELLAEDPQNRAPRVWEVMFPVPDQEGSPYDEQRRIRKAESCLRWFRRLVPEADAVYPMRARTPHECVAIHSYTFLSEEFISTCNVPAYEAFLHSTDLIPAYAWEKRFLQYLQLGCPDRRWVLKSPDHVHGLECLFRVFPDASVIQTHRNPLEVLHSSTDLNQVLRGLYGDPGNWSETYERETRVLAEGTERFIRFRDLHPEVANRFIDVKYHDLVTDSVTTVCQLYERLGLPFTNTVEERVQRLASQRSRYRGRRTASKPIDRPTHVETTRFERYCLRFGLQSEVPQAQ
jgi:hypothetical protein